MKECGYGEKEVAGAGEEGVEDYIGAAAAVVVREVRCEENDKEGEEVWWSGEGLGC